VAIEVFDGNVADPATLANQVKKLKRPVRLTMFNNPKDFDSMVGWEFGGYRAPAAKRAHLDTLRRDRVELHSGM
jgi:hypothetical protein